MKTFTGLFEEGRRSYHGDLDFMLCILHPEWESNCFDFYSGDGRLFVKEKGVTKKLIDEIDNEIVGAFNLMVYMSKNKE